MKERDLEESAEYLFEKLKEIKEICKDNSLSDKEKRYLIEVISEKMEKKLKERFKKLTESDE